MKAGQNTAQSDTISDFHLAPGRSQPRRSQPGRSQPGRSQPGRSQPGRSQPGRSQPGRSQPGRSQPGDFLAGLLRIAPETLEVEQLREILESLRILVDRELEQELLPLGTGAIDLAGTGGSGRAKFNTSTASAFILASAGIKVVKFGNRSITGSQGSIDFLSSLGIPHSLPVNCLAKIFPRTGILFISAHDAYPDLAQLREARRALGRPTVLNFIGPLLNPARPTSRYMGVSSSRLLTPLGKLAASDARLETALLMHSHNNLDEAESGVTYNAVIIKNGVLAPFENQATAETASGEYQFRRSYQSNASIFEAIISGDDTCSKEYRDLLLNSALALIAAQAVNTVGDGISLARKAIASKEVLKFMQNTRRVYREFA